MLGCVKIVKIIKQVKILVDAFDLFLNYGCLCFRTRKISFHDEDLF